MANFPLPNASVAYVPIQYLDANGIVTQGPSGDTLSIASSDPSLGVAIGTMPSGPLAGAACAVLTPLVVSDTNITVTVTDSANLTPSVQVYDITDVAVALSQDTADAVFVAQAPPTAKKAV